MAIITASPRTVEPSCRRTPCRSSVRLFTAQFFRISTFGRASRSLINARKMSSDLLLRGYTLLPRSSTSGTFRCSKNAISCVLNIWAKQLRTQRLSGPMWVMKSFNGAVLVRLHRPLPVMRSLRPAWSIFSTNTTSAPCSAAATAAIMPAAPAPTITTLLMTWRG